MREYNYIFLRIFQLYERSTVIVLYACCILVVYHNLPNSTIHFQARSKQPLFKKIQPRLVVVRPEIMRNSYMLSDYTDAPPLSTPKLN